MRPLFARGRFLAATALLAGCCHQIPVIEESLDCPIASERLQEQCAEPVAIAADATYADVLGAAINDRKNLRLCAVHDLLLAQTVAACNAAIAKHNQAIRKINDGAAKR